MKKGIFFALCAAVISGLSIFYNKLVVVKGIDSTIFNILKNGGAAIIVTTIILSKSKFKPFTTLSKSHWVKLFLIGAVGGSIPFVLFFEGLKTVPAINASLIQKTLFVWVTFLAVPFLKEKLSPLQIGGFLLVILSNFFIGGFKGFATNTAELMIFIATLFWAVENIIAKKALKTVDTKTVVWGRMFLGTVLLICYALVTNKFGLLNQVSPSHIFPIIGSVILLTGYVLSFYKALSLAPASLVTAILVLATPITNVLSAIFITHTLDALQIFNLFFSLTGIGIMTYVSLKSVHYGHTGTGALH
jgi:drug/metabolite transporter (DMT)-like permease